MLVGQSCTPSTLLVYEERGGIQKELESAVINQKVDQTVEGNIEKIKQNYMRAGHYLGQSTGSAMDSSSAININDNISASFSIVPYCFAFII